MEDGLRVVARTTGSKPVFILPDGSERDIYRRGIPSILEGKNLLREAVKQNAQAVVVEMMSIRPELTYTESVRLFRPHILVITNARLDHLEQIGEIKEEVTACFASAIPSQSTVFVPKKEFFPIYQEKATRVHSKVLKVPKETKDEGHSAGSPFIRDKQLVLAVTEFLDMGKNVALAGMKKAQADFGSLKGWESKGEIFPPGNSFISAFAANEPESTQLVLDYLEKKGIFNKKRLVALLNFREDRGDRTLQWGKALSKGFLNQFDRVILLGRHAPLVKNKLKSGFGMPEIVAKPIESPDEITKDVASETKETVVVGMGNMGGLGQELVAYWETIGEAYDL